MALFDWLPIGRVPEISVSDLYQRREHVQIIDVRTVQEFRSSHIPGARNLPITHFSEGAVSSLELDSSTPVIAICLSAHRSKPAVRKLQRMGFNAFQLHRGMNAWWQSGYETSNI